MKYRLLSLLCLPLLAAGQEFRGTILGRVTDPSGAAVAGASIVAVNAATNVTLRTSSSETGDYQIPFVLPGEYELQVEAAGFKRINRPGIRIATNEQVTLNFNLEIGAATETITVTAAAPLLATANADLGHVVDNVFVGTISVSLSRNIINIRNLAPGVTGSTGTYTSSAQDSFSIAGGGGTRGDNEVIIDGIPNTTVSGTIGFVPSVDSVEEVKVHTTMFDAAYGHSNGGAVSITTRGGSNELRGAAYYYKRWNSLYANSWTNNRLGLPKAPVEYHQWGYTVGGPVFVPKLYNGRNRTFFSTSLERDHDPRELTRQARVPTEAERQGDFSQTRNRLGGAFTIYDPATTVVSGSSATRTPFPGNRIPASRFDPTGAAVLGKFPSPTISGVSQIAALNWANSKTYTVDQSQVGARIDHVLSDKQRLFGRFGMLNRLQAADDLFFGATSFLGSGTDLGSLKRRRLSFGVDDTVVFSPTLVASFRASVLSYGTKNAGGAAGAPASDLKVADVILRNQAIVGWPNFNLGENLPGIGSSSSFSRDMIGSLLSTWSKLMGPHSLKWGVDYRLGRINNVNPGGNAPGTFNFSSTFTQLNPFNRQTADTSGTAMASALLGLADSGNLGYNTATSIQNHYWGLFAQHDWKATRKLTVNLGLRYELETPFTERFNRMTYRFDENAPLPVRIPGLELRGGVRFAGVDGNPRHAGSDRNNFGPRAGFAFSLTPKTVVRAGYGMFYSMISMNSGFFGAIGVFNAVTPYVGTIDGGATPFTTLANPFPGGLRTPQGSSIGLLAEVGNAISVFDDRRVNPYNQQWQFSVQRELPARVLFEAAYMGMHSVKQIESFNLNEKPDVYLALGAAENNRVPNPFLNVFPATSTLGQGTTITQNRLWVRFPQYTGLTVQGMNTGRALYHSLQVKADKRLSRGLSVLWTYTWARLMENYTTSVINVRKYRAVSDLDQKHVARLAFVYELPARFAGDGAANAVLRQVAGGWSLSGLAEFASGTPLSVSHTFGRPLRIRNPRLEGPVHTRLGDQRDASGRVVNPYFDITAFVPLANQYTVTPEPPLLDELRGPGTRALNMSLFKQFPIRERLKLELRLEGTGVTNTPRFANPGTNMSQAATFGVITSAGGSRAMQGALRVVF